MYVEQNVRELIVRLFGSRLLKGVDELSPEYLEIVEKTITSGLEMEYGFIIERSFGLRDGRCWTDEECARALHRAPKIIRRMRTSALVRLKYQLRDQLDQPF